MALGGGRADALFLPLLIDLLAKDGAAAVYKLNAAMGFLMATDIPFEVAYVPGTRKDERSLQLTVHINPKTTITVQL